MGLDTQGAETVLTGTHQPLIGEGTFVLKWDLWPPDLNMEVFKATASDYYMTDSRPVGLLTFFSKGWHRQRAAL